MRLSIYWSSKMSSSASVKLDTVTEDSKTRQSRGRSPPPPSDAPSGEGDGTGERAPSRGKMAQLVVKGLGLNVCVKDGSHQKGLSKGAHELVERKVTTKT